MIFHQLSKKIHNLPSYKLSSKYVGNFMLFNRSNRYFHKTHSKLKYLGTIKFFDDEKGYGFIAPMEGGEGVYVHISNFLTTNRNGSIDVGDIVEYDIKDTTKGLTAIHVSHRKRRKSY